MDIILPPNPVARVTAWRPIPSPTFVRSPAFRSIRLIGNSESALFLGVQSGPAIFADSKQTTDFQDVGA